MEALWKYFIRKSIPKLFASVVIMMCFYGKSIAGPYLQWMPHGGLGSYGDLLKTFAEKHIEKQSIEALDIREVKMPIAWGDCQEPRWSPSGSRFAVATGAGPTPILRVYQAPDSLLYSIYVVELENLKLTLTIVPGENTEPFSNEDLSYVFREYIWVNEKIMLISVICDEDIESWSIKFPNDVQDLDKHLRENFGPFTNGNPVFYDFDVSSGTPGYLALVTGDGACYICSHDTHNAVRVSRFSQPGAKVRCSAPKWSPKGDTTLVFHLASQEENEFIAEDIYLWGPPPGTPEPFVKQPKTKSSEVYPAWSPDGRRIAFYSNYWYQGDRETQGLFDIGVKDIADPEEENLPAYFVTVAENAWWNQERTHQQPTWLPDGSGLIYIDRKKRDLMIAPLPMIWDYVGEMMDVSNRDTSYCLDKGEWRSIAVSPRGCSALGIARKYGRDRLFYILTNMKGKEQNELPW